MRRKFKVGDWVVAIDLRRQQGREAEAMYPIYIGPITYVGTRVKYPYPYPYTVEGFCFKASELRLATEEEILTAKLCGE